MNVIIKMKKSDKIYTLENSDNGNIVEIVDNYIHAESILELLDFHVDNNYKFELDEEIDAENDIIKAFKDFFTKLVDEINEIQIPEN